MWHDDGVIVAFARRLAPCGSDVVQAREMMLMNILVTAGPTREFFDSVRFISNPSSGKMGYAIATQAACRGHEVTLIAGPVALDDPPGVEVRHVVTAQDMFEAAKSAFQAAHAVVMTAAVCDYRPTQCLDKKLAKSDQPRHITLEATEDICTHLGKHKGHRVVIGFAMEDHDHQAHAEAKLRRKHCDAIVLNGPDNVGSDQAQVQILQVGGTWGAPISDTKANIAKLIVELIERLVHPE